MFCIKTGGVDQTAYDCNQVDALLVISKTELSQLSPFYLDQISAVAIGGAILMIMAVAFVLRLIRKSLESSNESEI